MLAPPSSIKQYEPIERAICMLLNTNNQKLQDQHSIAINSHSTVHPIATYHVHKHFKFHLSGAIESCVHLIFHYFIIFLASNHSLFIARNTKIHQGASQASRVADLETWESLENAIAGRFNIKYKTCCLVHIKTNSFNVEFHPGFFQAQQKQWSS